MFSILPNFIRRIVIGAAIAGLGLGVSAGSAGAAAGDRPWVFTRGDQVRDLYVDGELTDSRGARWQVAIVPGVRPTLRGAGESFGDAGARFGDAGDALARYGTGDFWRARGSDFRNGLDFAVDDCLGDVVARGIARSVRETRSAVGQTVDEKPFGWIPLAAGQSAKGYVLEPAGRLIVGTGGAVLGAGYAVIAPPLKTTGPVLEAGADSFAAVVLDGAIEGVLVPTLKLAWHHPAMALAVLNREPKPEHDGRFGLERVR